MPTETTQTLEEQHLLLGRELVRNRVNACRPDKHSNSQSTTTIKLTPREQQILTLLAKGDTSKIMGELLGVSFRTIEHHRANLLKKFSQKNSISLVQTARHHGLL